WRNDGEDAQHCLTQAAQGPERRVAAEFAIATFRSHGRAAAKSQTKNESGCLKHVVPMTQMAVDYGQQLPCQPPCQEASPGTNSAQILVQILRADPLTELFLHRRPAGTLDLQAFQRLRQALAQLGGIAGRAVRQRQESDRKSTRLNSSH